MRGFNTAAQVVVHPEAVSNASVDERLGFLRRTYGWMFGAILLTAVGAAISIETGLALVSLRMGFIGMIVTILGWIGLAWVLQRVRHKPVVNVIAFAAYALFTGWVISSSIYVATLIAAAKGLAPMTYVYQALGLTLITFLGLSAYALTTKRDFSFMRGMLTVGLFCLLGMVVISFFFQSSVFSMIISGFGVLLFAGYTLYDTQKVMKTYPKNEHVVGAMTLFLDFVLLFVYILSLILQIAAAGDD